MEQGLVIHVRVQERTMSSCCTEFEVGSASQFMTGRRNPVVQPNRMSFSYIAQFGKPALLLGGVGIF